MHIGFSMICLSPQGLTRSELREKALEIARRHSLTGIELILEGIGGLWSPYPWEWQEEEIEEVKEFLTNFGKTGAHLPFINMNLVALNTRVREETLTQIEAAIEVVKKLDVDYAVVHANGSTDRWAANMEPHWLLESLRRLARPLEGSGTSLSIENGYNLNDLGVWLEAVQTLKTEGLPVSMTLDTGKANLVLEGEKPAYHVFETMTGAVEKCFALLDNIHLHNHKEGTFISHLGLKEGDIDLEALVRTLKRLGFEGSLTLELTPTPEEKLDKEISIMKTWDE